jgi:hypothetical protein
VDLPGGVLPILVSTGFVVGHGQADLPHGEHLVIAYGEVDATDRATSNFLWHICDTQE